MKLRTQLVVAFLLLAVLPLSGIVLYSYVTSTQTFRHAVEEEARQITRDIEKRMGSVKAELRERLQFIGALPASRRAFEVEGGALSPRMFEELFEQMGEAASWIESVEFVPGPEAETTAAVANAETAESDALFMNIDRQPADEGEPEGHFRVEILRRHQGEVRQVHELQRQKIEEATVRLDRQLQSLERELEEQTRLAREQGAALPVGRVDPHLAMDQAIETGILEAQIAALMRRRDRMAQMLGDEFSSTVLEGEKVVGFLKATVSAPQLVREVLRRTRRDEGELPFALDGDGNLYASSHEDLAALEKLPMDLKRFAKAGESGTAGIEDWVVVLREDPDSSLIFGIARPIGATLRQMRQTSLRNLGLGVGMIGLALLGILPLSSRLTRNLNRLTEDVGRLAEGSLDVRSSIRSRDELGHLAGAFNRMAEDLQRHQAQLLEQERRSRKQEVERSLLEAENRRKSEELEEARRFQLSLLPKRLPSHPEIEVAVFMQTATEVGGDYYDFQQDEEGRLTVAVGDATGHGAKAGTMVTAIKSLFVSFSGSVAPADFLYRASSAVRGMELGRMSMALTLARIEDGGLTLAAAGMPPALLCRDGTVEELGTESLPLGAALQSRYVERSAELLAGDTILLMSDGFPELLDPQGEPLGYVRVRDVFREAASRPVRGVIEHLAANVGRWGQGEAPSDDVTFVVLRMRSTPVSGGRSDRDD